MLLSIKQIQLTKSVKLLNLLWFCSPIGFCLLTKNEPICKNVLTYKKNIFLQCTLPTPFLNSPHDGNIFFKNYFILVTKPTSSFKEETCRESLVRFIKARKNNIISIFQLSFSFFFQQNGFLRSQRRERKQAHIQIEYFLLYTHSSHDSSLGNIFMVQNTNNRKHTILYSKTSYSKNKNRLNPPRTKTGTNCKSWVEMQPYSSLKISID